MKQRSGNSASPSTSNTASSPPRPSHPYDQSAAIRPPFAIRIRPSPRNPHDQYPARKTIRIRLATGSAAEGGAFFAYRAAEGVGDGAGPGWAAGAVGPGVDGGELEVIADGVDVGLAALAVDFGVVGGAVGVADGAVGDTGAGDGGGEAVVGVGGFDTVVIVLDYLSSPFVLISYFQDRPARARGDGRKGLRPSSG